MGTGRITKRSVEAIQKPSEGSRAYLWDDLLKGFGVMVTPAGSRSYLVQYRMGGRGSPTRRYTIGKHGSPFTAERAREVAIGVLETVRKGTDPVDAARLAVTEAQAARADGKRLAFEAYTKIFMERHVQRRNLRSEKDIDSVLRRDLIPYFKTKPLGLITRASIQECLDKIGDRTPSAANKAHKWLRKMLAFAVDRGDLDKSPMVGIVRPYPEVSRERALSDKEIASLWAATEGLADPWQSFVRVLMLTGQRLREVGRMDWKELNLERREWIIPPARSKNKRFHLVPLSAPVIAILKANNPAKGGPVFTTGGGKPIGGFSKCKSSLDVELAKVSPKFERFTFHDLRRTMATGLQRLGFPTEHIEAVLNHTSGKTGGLVATYQTHDFLPEKRKALDAWASQVGKSA